jgi:hypothetical protein
MTPEKRLEIEFNKEIIDCKDGMEILQLLQSKPLAQKACSNVLSPVNFSTAVHRLARNSLSDASQRTAILNDARFALFLASLAEAIDQGVFGSRELSNIAWALTKLRNFVPPQTAMPIENDAAILQEKLQLSASEVRRHIQEAATMRASGRESNTQLQLPWVPEMSKLAGHIVDYVSMYVLNQESKPDNERSNSKRQFQLQEYANLLWAFSTSGRESSKIFGLVARNMIKEQRHQLLHEVQSEQESPRLHPQEWSNSIWAMGNARCYESSGDFIEFISFLLTEFPDFVKLFKPQELSNTLWGVATLLSNKNEADGEQDKTISQQEEAAALAIFRVCAQELASGITDHMKSQELSNSIWALATVGFGLTPFVAHNMNNYLVLSSDRQSDDEKLMNRAALAIARSSLQLLPKFRPQELNNLSWAIARLVDNANEAPFPDLFRGIGEQLSRIRRGVTSQDIGTTMWGMATVGFFDEKIYRKILERLTPEMIRQSRPQELSNIVWSVATADLPVGDEDCFDTSLLSDECRPKITDRVTHVFSAVASELMERPEQFKPQEIKDILWSFSRLGFRYPRLFKFVAEYLVGGVEEDSKYKVGRGLAGFSPQALGNLAYSFARQGQLAACVSKRQENSRISHTSGRLSVYTACFFDFGESLLHKLFVAIGDAQLEDHDNLRKLKPQDLANTIWTYAVLGLKFNRFAETVRDESARRLADYTAGHVNKMNMFKGQEIANILWALATVNVDPGALLDAVDSYLGCILGRGFQSPDTVAVVLKRQELANIAWSCAVFWKFPMSLMELLYSGLVGAGTEQDRELLNRAHGDNGLQSQAIMTLIYVQTAMDLEGAGKLSLPPNFPKGWQETSPSTSVDDSLDSIIELQLSTSKIQLAVSAAFDRIGFSHVSEHTITMGDLAKHHGVRLADSPLEVLSVDLANLQQKIAIEVDGPGHYLNEIDHYSDVSETYGYSTLIRGKLEYQFQWKGDRQQINGSTVLKERLLGLLGWKTIHIAFWDFYALHGDEAAEDNYCRELLKSIS